MICVPLSIMQAELVSLAIKDTLWLTEFAPFLKLKLLDLLTLVAEPGIGTIKDVLSALPDGLSTNKVFVLL